ncbi:hypothetical protein FISHEDRAFT_64331 [Fistulina hepatica ATCC 64428]|uniref:glucan endo-1,3-beta-D-glucosidase n=1 Tax=Fistulina hepatica ATCC 64428 TaxID=1128425 RepID=A0A0D7AJ54_9AGAR|nr:hypothetical protein FISHEDRAFT_64331 [Fistulina hepatica ATCC 64428]
MPPEVPHSLSNWWCDPKTEYAFMGFSYEVTECQSLSKLKREFSNARDTFGARYVRLYGACDNDGFYNNVIEAAWHAQIGVHALIWFGFDGDDKWMTRRDQLYATLHSNPKAQFVTRMVQFVHELADQVWTAKAALADLGIPITVSEMAYGYQERGGAKSVLDAIDAVDAHMLPFFAQDASTANKSWHIVTRDLDWFMDNGEDKKIYFSENGWPSVTSAGVQPNSPDAVADVQNEQDYFVLLDSKCTFFKTVRGGGVGWFAHIYSEEQEPGYGIYKESGKLKIKFAPRTSC